MMHRKRSFEDSSRVTVADFSADDAEFEFAENSGALGCSKLPA
jgi:hypothetical protein